MPPIPDENKERGWLPAFKHTSVVILPVFLLVIGIITAVLWSEIRTHRIVARQNENARVVVGKQLIQNTLRPVVKDLDFLARLVAASGILFADTSSQRTVKTRLEEALGDLSAAHGYYDQIRVIDATGMERVRVNYNDGHPEAVADADLQMKADRYYFQETMRRAPGDVYFSPLDLNIEHGRIQLPLKPMIRLATPIANNGTGNAGILILNFNANVLLDNFSGSNPEGAAPLMLLNADGYWLKGMSRKDEFGFMFADGKKLTFGERYPDVWQAIQTRKTGQIKTARGIFMFATVFPLEFFPDAIACTGCKKTMNAKALRWIIVAHHPIDHIEAFESRLVFKAFLASLVAVLVLLLVSVRLLSTDIHRRRADRELRRAKQNLEMTVASRTSELAQSNAALRSQIDVRKRIEQALGDSEVKYRAMMEAMDDFAFICGADHKIEYINPAMAHRYGDAVVGKACYRALFNRDAACQDCPQGTVQNGSANKCQDVQSIDDRYYHVSHNPIHHPDGSISVLTIYRDISDLRAAQTAKLESERQFRTLVETMHEGVFIIDADDRFTFVNEQFSVMLGYRPDEIVGRTVTDCLVSENEDGLKRAIDHFAAGGIAPYELAWVHHRGDTVLTHISPCALSAGDGTDGGSFAVVTDITEIKRAEREKRELENKLRQAQKMEAIGVLAGGIAHDFNNILMPIMGFTELINASLADNDKVRKYIQPIMEASHRAKELVCQILSFSRQSGDTLKPTMIGPLVSEPLKLLKASIPSNIEIKRRITAKNAMIMANPVQIHQVVMNLCTNAYQAMEKTGGSLSVSLEKTEYAPTEGKAGDPGPRPCVRLSVADTGPGIPAEFLPRIFEPYFTTKDNDNGTGLGLSLVHSIVTACGGEIRVESQVGEGTTFNVYFPLVVRAEEGGEKDVAADLVGGTEHILLVDDEAPIVKLEKSILERLGYTVTTKLSSLEALETFESDPNAFDLVITDLTMPGFTGLALAERLTSIRPGLPIIMLTGFSENLKGPEVAAAGIRRVIMKPALTKDLAEAIRQAIDGGGGDDRVYDGDSTSDDVHFSIA